MSDLATWTPVATIDELWEGEVAEFYAGDQPILLAHLRNGEIRAYEGNCPHAGFPLVDGEVVDDVLTCSAHSWEFDLRTGTGINPPTCSLRSYQVRRDGDQIAVLLNGDNT